MAKALRASATDAEETWRRANDAIVRREADRKIKASHIDNWDSLPRLADLPSDVLDLLDTQRKAVEQLPYEKLRVVAPKLVSIHVRQQLRSSGVSNMNRDQKSEQIRTRPGKEPQETVAETVEPVAEALNKYDHILVIGDAGSGKSTLGHHFTRVLAEAWLRRERPEESAIQRPLMPLRVPARELVRPGSWCKVVADAVNHTLGRMLRSELGSHLFERRICGAPWLIFVDGLDEIDNANQRRDLIRDIASHAIPDGDYRFVVCTRDLPSIDLAPLESAHFSRFSIEPFGKSELASFAQKWFDIQAVAGHAAEELTQRYLHQIRDSRLRELVQNPLLATVCAILLTREPDASLPTIRLDLYERFCSYLLHEGGSERVDWAYHNRTTLIEALGQARVQSEESLLDAAMTWVGKHQPPDVSTPPTEREDLRDLLISTGVFVLEGEDIRFLHHSFAEYFAARAVSSTLSTDPSDLEPWMRRWRERPDQAFVLFILLEWGRRNGNNLTTVIEELLAIGPKYVRLAGQLVAEGTAIRDEIVHRVTSKLIDLAVATNSDEYYDVLGAMCENDVVSAQLRALIDLAALPIGAKIKAAVALAHVKGAAEALPVLRRLAVEGDGSDLLILGRELADLLPTDQHDEAREILTRVATQSRADVGLRAAAAEALYDLECTEVASLVAEEAFTDSLGGPFEIVGTARALLKIRGPSAGEHIALHVAGQDLGGWTNAKLAEELADAGRGDLVMPFVRAAVQHTDSDGIDLSIAIRSCYKAGQAEDMAYIVNAIAKKPKLSMWDWVNLAECLVDIGQASDAVSLLRQAIDTSNQGESSYEELATVWTKAKGLDSAPELVALVEQRYSPIDERIAWLAKGMATAGCTDLAEQLARRIMESEDASCAAVGAAAKAWQDAANGSVGSQIDSFLASQYNRFTTWDCASLAGSLADANCKIAADVARSVLHSHTAGGYEIERAASALLQVVGDSAVGEIVSCASVRPASTAFSVAGVLATFGSREAAGRLLIDALAEMTAIDAVASAARLLELGLRPFAIEALQSKLRAEDIDPPRAAVIRATVAWITLMDPDTKSCGIPTCRKD